MQRTAKSSAHLPLVDDHEVLHLPLEHASLHSSAKRYSLVRVDDALHAADTAAQHARGTGRSQQKELRGVTEAHTPFPWIGWRPGSGAVGKHAWRR